MDQTPIDTNKGQLIRQLRGLALKGSDDGSWNEPVEQTTINFRSTNLKGETHLFAKVEFEAKKAKQDFGRGVLRTVYSLRASVIQTELGLENLPQSVREASRRKKIAVGDGDDEPEALVMRFNDDEVDEHEFDGYEEMMFRHVQGLSFTLNGRGDLLNTTRENFYETDDEGGVDIYGVRSEQPSNLFAEEAQTLHPDLKQLTFKKGAKELGEELSFLGIVEDYVADKELVRYSQMERYRDMLTMVAFLNYEASTKVIEDLL